VHPSGGIIEAMFRDRGEAGKRLALAVSGRTRPDRSVVLAIPRGGVVVAVPVAEALDAPLDVVVPHKLGAPGNPELAIGAIAPGVRVLDERLIRLLGVPAEYLDDEVSRQEAEIERRLRLYREGREAPVLAERDVIVVDDGIATGATAVAALRWARGQTATRVLFAAPVGPPATVRKLSDECDDVVVLEMPASFCAVGEWYEAFGQVTDREVLAALRRGR
jgi:putative phosphoribosyl transferase